MAQRMCMGTFVMALIANTLLGTSIAMNVVALVTIVLLGLAMCGTMTHLGKPGRVLNTFANPTSHLTLEIVTCVPVALCYLVIAANGFLYQLPAAASVVLEWVGAACSVLFIWVTARAYRMKARPAWASVFTPLNFMLTFLAGGSMGACAFAGYMDGAVSTLLLVVTAVLLVVALAGQAVFTYYVAHVGYHVDINPFAPECRGWYVAWILFGVLVPVFCIVALFAKPFFAGIALVMVLSNVIALIAWQGFFFLTGKEVWFFPQYEMDLSPDYY